MKNCKTLKVYETKDQKGYSSSGVEDLQSPMKEMLVGICKELIAKKKT